MIPHLFDKTIIRIKILVTKYCLFFLQYNVSESNNILLVNSTYLELLKNVNSWKRGHTVGGRKGKGRNNIKENVISNKVYKSNLSLMSLITR